MKKILYVVCTLAVLISTAYADDTGAIYKWSQLPDMTPMGRDINATSPNILADDWLCENGLNITDIHWWGSYLGWQVNTPPEQLVINVQHPDSFNFSQHLDIPAGGQYPYSQPGAQINGASAAAGQYTWNYYGSIQTGAATWEHVFQYNFILPQEWSQKQGMVYWLDISAVYNAGTQLPWGWHTSATQWNDSAVKNVVGGGWEPITYPERTDLAFELSTVPEPGAMMLFGLGVFSWFMRKLRKR